MAKVEDVVPLIGLRRVQQTEDALAAQEIRLTEEEIDQIEAAFPAPEVAGTRYDKHQMAMLDGER
jgi:aryl-alcohol dehydrogenase-like predicted oxidoreductase